MKRVCLVPFLRNVNLLNRTLHPDKVEDLNKFRQYLESSSDELKPLKVWQFQELSLQAAERIMSEPTDKALNTLIHIAQNFPMQVSKRKFDNSNVYIAKTQFSIENEFSYFADQIVGRCSSETGA